MSDDRACGAAGVSSGRRRLEVGFDDFAWEAIEQESARAAVSPEELVAFAVLYYLADVDSGRVARRIPRGQADASDGE